MNELSNRPLELQALNGQNQDQASDFVKVRSKNKKSEGSKSPQGQQAATGMDQEHQEHVARQRDNNTVLSISTDGRRKASATSLREVGYFFP